MKKTAFTTGQGPSTSFRSMPMGLTNAPADVPAGYGAGVKGAAMAHLHGVS